MKETWEEFRREVLKVSGNRIHKVTNSYGVYDAYKYYRKNKPKDPEYILTESQYFSIIRKINLLLVRELLECKDIVLPKRMGTIQIRKRDRVIKFNNGKLITNLPIDWDNTLKLWYEDKEAYDNKILVRENPSEIFRILYIKHKALYKNKSYYVFRPNREIKKQLVAKAKGKLIDTYLIR